MSKTTPLYEVHVALGAKMVPFAGFEMPVQYDGIVAEHLAVRQNAGLFDVSHMGEFWVEGDEATAFLQHLVSNDIGKMYDGRAMYAVMCNEDGFALDDLIVYRINEKQYLLVVNAGNIDKDWAWVQQQNTFDVKLENRSDQMSLLALQGPKALDILQSLTDTPLSDLPYYHFLSVADFLGKHQVLISHTGYTGEKGFEIYCQNEAVVEIWESLLQAGAPHGLKPCGLGARDTLRLEAGYCLYGHELTESIHPLEAGLGWVTKFNKPDFIGKTALQNFKQNGLKRKLVAFILSDRGIPRQDYPICTDDGTPIGIVSSGSQSPILQKGIGLGFVENSTQYTSIGSPIFINIRGKLLAATVAQTPLHQNQ